LLPGQQGCATAFFSYVKGIAGGVQVGTQSAEEGPAREGRGEVRVAQE